MRPTPTTVTLLLAATALVASTAPAADAVTVPARHGAAPAAATAGVSTAAVIKVGGWTRLSNKGLSSINEPHAMTLAGGGAQVVWSQSDTVSTESVRTRIVKKGGALASDIKPVVSGWATTINDPKIIKSGSQRMVVFSGIRTTNPGEKYYGPLVYSTSTDGTSWTLGTGSMSQTAYAYASYGTSAIDDGGVPMASVVAASTNFVTVHRGTDPSIPASGGDWTTDKSLSGNSLNATLGRDSSNGRVWEVWVQDFSSKKGQQGIIAQRVYPTPTGSWMKAPASTTKAGDFLTTSQDVAVASRVGGQVWAAYPVGYPTANKIRLWRVGSAKAGFTVTSKDVRRISLQPGPGGRLWLAWSTGYDGIVHVARTNPAVTRIGAVRSFKPPTKKGASAYVWKVVGTGAGAGFHLVINSGYGSASPQIWYRHVYAGLTVGASPSRLGYGRVTITVRDAGRVVPGAKVRFLGHTKTTNANGKATFTVSRSVSAGKKKVSVSKSGYASRSITVRVT